MGWWKKTQSKDKKAGQSQTENQTLVAVVPKKTLRV
jgi:hypothetical protein